MFGFLSSSKTMLESGLLKGAVDNHSHILYGVDDGVSTQEESLAILSYLEAAGLKTLWLTPHTMEDVPNTTAGLKERFDALRAVYRGPIELQLASEYMIDTLFEQHLEEGDLFLHGEDRVLVETSTWSPPINLWDILSEMLRKGYRPILAHPERYRYMTAADYKRLHEMGVLFQLNLPSVLGVYGEGTMRRAAELLEKGWYAMAGSDCHRMRSITGQYSSKVLKSAQIKQLEPLMKEA